MREPTPSRPSPAAAPAPAPTAPQLSSPTSSPPPPSQLSPLATPFFPSSVGRSKQQRWMDSPISPADAGELPGGRSPAKASYRDVVVRAGPQPSCDSRSRQSSLPPPQQPPRLRLRSEIHRVEDAAAEVDGWRVVARRRSRRRGEAQQKRPQRIPAAMDGRCFNCLEKGHWKAACREPTRCLRCARPGHRSFECRRPRNPQPQLRGTQEPPAPRPEKRGSYSHVGEAAQDRAPEFQSRRSRRNRRRHGCRGGGRRRKQEGRRVRARRNAHCTTPPHRPPHHRRDLGKRDHRMPATYRGPSILNNGRRSMNTGRCCCRLLVPARRSRRSKPSKRWQRSFNSTLISGLRCTGQPKPYDFFLILPDHGALQRVLGGDRMVRPPAFQLRIQPWNRLVYAEHGVLYHKVLIELEGIPLHVWDYTTAGDLLRPYCSLESMDPDTAERRDLSVFRVTAWTTRPEFIPECRPLLVPEPTFADMPPEPMRRTLRYMVRIRVRRLLVQFPPDSPSPSPLPTPPPTDDDSSSRSHKRFRRRRRRFLSEREEARDEDTQPSLEEETDGGWP